MAFIIQHLELPGPVYYAGPISGWVTDASLAVQYAAEADAQAVIDQFRMYAATLPSGSSGLFSGRYLGTQYFKTAGANAYTPTPGTNSVVIELVGGGGGGGGADTTGAGTVSIGDSGCGGAYWRKRVTTGIGVGTATVGDKGLGGTAGANLGGTGGTTSFTFTGSGVTWTAGGGAGGQGRVAAAPPMLGLIPSPGFPGTGSDLSSIGNYPAIGLCATTTLAVSGNGGSCLFGGGGEGGFATGVGQQAGQVGLAIGAGGSGAVSLGGGTSRAGGNGAVGAVIISEYS